MGLCEHLVAWWSFDEAADPREDSRGGNDATQDIGAGPQDTGLVGSSIALGHFTTGTSPFFNYDRWKTTGSNAVWGPDGSFWCGGWVRFDLQGNDSRQLSLLQADLGQGDWSIGYMPVPTVAVDGVTRTGFYFIVHDGGSSSGDQTGVDTGAAVPDDEWHFLLCWYDAAGPTINLQLDDDAPITAALPNTLEGDSGTILFGDGSISPTLPSTPTDIRLDEWTFGKGGLPTSGDRTWLFNTAAGRAYSELEAYCGIELTETLVLIVADPAGIISDPAIPPAGGTGAPKRFDDGGFTDDCGPESAAATVCTRTSRTLPVALAAHLAGTALTLAYCLRLARRDGEVFGFTTHDRDLTFGGTTYEALNSLAVTALRQELGGSVGNLDLSGLIRSDRVTAADLLAGRYDGAEITLRLVNWSDLGGGSVILARGWFGAVTLVDGQWQAEYRSLAQRLQQEIVRVTSPLCDVAQLGDDRCKVNLAGFTFSRTVASVSSTREMVFSGDSHGSGYYSHGRVTFTSGENDGLDREIKRHTHAGSTAVIECQLGFPFVIAPGDTADLEAGCDRRMVTCVSRFSNISNFRGFPHVPGWNILKKVKHLRTVG